MAQSLKNNVLEKTDKTGRCLDIFFTFFGPNSFLGQGTTYNFFPEVCFLSNSFYSQKRNWHEGLFRVSLFLPL